jgi:hypothetical protein
MMCNAAAYTPEATGAAKMLKSIVVVIDRFPSLLIGVGM